MSTDHLSPNVAARARRCAPSVPAGQILVQVALWHPFMKVKRDGKLWVVQTREELMHDAQLGRSALDAAVKLLEDEGLIERAVFFFKQKRTLHLRLTDRAMALIRPYAPKATTGDQVVAAGASSGFPVVGKEPAEAASSGYPVVAPAPSSGFPVHASSGNPVVLYKTEDLTEEQESEDKKVAGPEGPADSSHVQSFKEFQEEWMAKKGYDHETSKLAGIGVSKASPSASLAKVREQLTAQKTKGLKASEVLPALAKAPKTTPSSLSGKLQQVWKQGLFDHHSQSVVVLGVAEKGMLKTFAVACEEGQADAGAILEHVIRRWSKFVERVQAENGTKWETQVPTVKYLVAFRQTAINWSLKCFKQAEDAKIAQAKVAEKAAETAKVAQAPKTESPVPAKPKQEKVFMTLDDLNELSKELGL